MDRAGFGPAVTEHLVTIPEACSRLGISRSTFYELLYAGRIEAVKIGRSRRVRSSEIERFIADLSTEAPQGAA